MNEVILAIGGGGSRTRCVAVSQSGGAMGAGESGATNDLLVERKTFSESFREAISVRANLKNSGIACVSAGLAEVDYDDSGSGEMEELLRGFGFKNSLINGDVLIARAGALAGEAGVLALAGNGSSIPGIEVAGQSAKVKEPIFSDEGSA